MVGAILGGAQVLKGIGGLFGGGPRAPRMNQQQKQQMQQQMQQQQGCNQHMMGGCQRVNQCSQNFGGKPMSAYAAGFIAGEAMSMAGSGGYGGNNNQCGCANQMDRLFQPPFGPGFGGGMPFQAPMVGFAVGFAMNA